MAVRSNDLPSISKVEQLGSPINVAPIVDNSSKFDLPFQLEDLPRMAELYEGEGIALGNKTVTERRSYTYEPTVIRRLNPIIRNEEVKNGLLYCDLQIKGGGAIIPKNVLLYRKTKRTSLRPYDPATALHSHVQLADGIAPVRFTTHRLDSLSDELGFVYDKNELSDLAISQYLESQYGLRTRALVAMWEIPDETPIVTPEGKITIGEAKKILGKTPVLDAWALRCKYRVQDPLRMVYEVESGDPEPNSIGLKLRYAGLPLAIMRDNQEDDLTHLGHDPDNSLTTEQKVFCLEQFCDLAKQIIGRALHDEDSRFVELATQYQDIVKIKKISVNERQLIAQFYKDYLYVFSAVLGQQFGIMEEADAISGMMNLQNITLLAELPDNDVVLIHGKTMQFDVDGNPEFVDPDPADLKEYAYKPKDPVENYIRQLHHGWEAISLLIRDLSRTGVITIHDEILNTRDNFLKEYAAHLRSYLNVQEYAEKMSYVERWTSMMIEDYGFNNYDIYYQKRINPADILDEGERLAFLTSLHEFAKTA